MSPDADEHAAARAWYDIAACAGMRRGPYRSQRGSPACASAGRQHGPARARARAHACRTRARSYTGHTFAKFLITITSGLLTGVFAVGLSTIVHHAFEWKNEYIQSLIDAPGQARVFVAFLWHCAYSCCLVSFAVALVSGRWWGPGRGQGGR